MRKAPEIVRFRGLEAVIFFYFAIRGVKLKRNRCILTDQNFKTAIIRNLKKAQSDPPIQSSNDKVVKCYWQMLDLVTVPIRAR